MAQMRLASKTEMLNLARAGDYYDFNRRADVDVLGKELDPNGTNVLSLLLFDHHREDHLPVDKRKDPMHHRIMVLAKVNGEDDPVEFMMDIAAKDWDALPIAPKTTPEDASFPSIPNFSPVERP